MSAEDRLYRRFAETMGVKLAAEHEDKLPGGLADKKQPKDFDKLQLEAGVKVEMEHTSDRVAAQEIAMDHLTEDPDYYKKLKTIEKKSSAEDALVDGFIDEIEKLAKPELPVSQKDREDLYAKHGQKPGCSLGRDKKGFYVYTHRARSPSYPTPGDIPKDKVRFIESTG